MTQINQTNCCVVQACVASCALSLFLFPACPWCLLAKNELDLAAIAHAHVYYEKLVMMVSHASRAVFVGSKQDFCVGPDLLQGKVMKSNRKVLAGVCLLLAVKFSTDMKKTEISNLIEVSSSMPT